MCTRVCTSTKRIPERARRVHAPSGDEGVLCADFSASSRTASRRRSAAAAADRGDLTDSFSQSDTFRHTPSINIILTLHVCAYACVCAGECGRIQMSERIQVFLRTPHACVSCVWERLWVIDSGVIYYSTVTSISKVSCLCASLRSHPPHPPSPSLPLCLQGQS